MLPDSLLAFVATLEQAGDAVLDDPEVFEIGLWGSHELDPAEAGARALLDAFEEDWYAPDAELLPAQVARALRARLPKPG